MRCRVQRQRVFRSAFRDVAAGFVGCANRTIVAWLRCRSPLAESGCLCPLAPDWRTAIARPKDAPRFNRFSIQPSSRRCVAGGTGEVAQSALAELFGNGGNRSGKDRGSFLLILSERNFPKIQFAQNRGITEWPGPDSPPHPAHRRDGSAPEKRDSLRFFCAACPSAIHPSWRSWRWPRAWLLARNAPRAKLTTLILKPATIPPSGWTVWERSGRNKGVLIYKCILWSVAVGPPGRTPSHKRSRSIKQKRSECAIVTVLQTTT